MKAITYSKAGIKKGEVALSKAVFGVEANADQLKDAYNRFLSNVRTNNAKVLTRGDVSGGGKKPWRQKGTGRARAGMASSPIWRGGGKIFASSPDENFSQKVNRKMFRAGMASILSQLAREDRIRVVDDLTLDTPKTKLLAQKVKSMGFDGVLVITDEVSENLMLSSRNLNNVEVMAAHHADPVSLVRFPNVLLTKKAMAKLEEMFK